MSSQVVDRLVMELGLEFGKFRSQAGEAERVNQKLKQSLEGTEQASDDAAAGTKKLGDETEKSGKKAKVSAKSFLEVATSVGRLFGSIMGSRALYVLANGVAKANDQLGFMQQRLGVSAESFTKMGNAAAMLGGDAASMQNAMQDINQSLQELAIMGDSAMLPFLNAMGVAAVDASGKIRDIDDVMLDMADSLSKMDPKQAYAIASAMGLDDGVANALIQGRDAMQEMIDLQGGLYTSTQEEINASRELNKEQAKLSAHWDGLKTMLGNALIPALTKLTQGAQGFVDFLMRNERTVKNIFEGFAYVIGVVAVAALGKALKATIALLAPFGMVAAAILAVGAAFLALYDDYKVWAAGGKSLFDWSLFDNYLKNASVSADSLASAFVRLFTGYNSLDEALDGITKWLTLKGFIDENGVSIGSLAEGFRNLAGDIMDALPILQVFASMVGKLLSGDFSGALSDAAKIPAAALQTVGGLVGAGVEHLGGVIDTAAGIDPESDGSLAGFARVARATVGGWLDTAAGYLPEGMRFTGGGAASGSSPQAGSAAAAVDFSRGASVSPISNSSSTSTRTTDVSVNVGAITVQTSASTLPAITNEALGAALSKGNDSLNQLASGL